MTEFPGFNTSDVEIFSLPGFDERMGALRSQLRPKLLALGAELAPELALRVDGPIHPHTAAHMRRRVNPPAETWVAFARNARGYKRWAHFRVAVSGSGVRVVVFTEDDADDKPALAEALQARAPQLAGAEALQPVLWYTAAADGEDAPSTADLGADGIRRLGATLGRLKTAKFQAGVWLPERVAFGSPETLREAALAEMERLAPLYAAAAR